MRRRTALRIGGWVAAAGLAFTGVSVAHPGGVFGLIEDVCLHGQNVERLEEGKTDGQQIDSAIRAREERLRSLDELSGALAAGTVRLRPAAEFYLSVVAAEPVFFNLYRDSFPGSSDLERMAVALLKAAFTLPVTAANRYSLMTQFHAEFGTDYPLSLPAVESRFASGRQTHP